MSDIIRTDRLVLRPPARRDADAIVALAGDWDVARMTGRIPHPYTRADAEHFLGLDIGARMAEFQGQVVGCFGAEAKANGAIELGYWIGKPFWGRGFATEGARGLIRHLRAQDPNSRIAVSHMADNPASRRVIEKLGFQPAGESAIWSVARGCTVRVLCYELPGAVPESD
jgi:ribosomal-protein-alanine N-acetyltransferase